MGGGIDLWTLVLVIGVIVLFGWFFWHTATAMVSYARQITHYLDTRSERLRQKLEYEQMHGPLPLWYRVIQKGLILLIVVGAATLVWMKFRGLASPH